MLDSLIDLYYKVWIWFDRRNLDPKYWEKEQVTNTGLYGPSSSHNTQWTPLFTHEECKNLVKRSNKVPPLPNPPPARIITEGKLPYPPKYFPIDVFKISADPLQTLKFICSKLEDYIFHHNLSKHTARPKIEVITRVEECFMNSALLYNIDIKANGSSLLWMQIPTSPEIHTQKSDYVWDVMYQKMISNIYYIGFEGLTLRYHALIKGSRDITDLDRIVLPENKYKMKVKSVKYNWHPSGSTIDRDGAGDDWERFVVGEFGVVSIEEYVPQNAFQVWNYVVNLENGVRYRIFNPNFVEYFSE